MNIICRIDQSFKEPHILFPETWEWDQCATWLSERDIEGTFVSLCEEALCFIVANPRPSDPSGGSTSHPEEKTPSTGHSAHGKGIL